MNEEARDRALTSANEWQFFIDILDSEQEGLAEKFDLVFCSTTPAVNGIIGLEKTIQMAGS